MRAMATRWMSGRVLLLAAMMSVQFANAGICCNPIPFGDNSWCHRSNCLGAGCQLDDPSTPEDESLRQCSDITQCVCAGLVGWTTKSFCSIERSCKNAQADYDSAKKWIVDRTTENPGEECVKVLLNVVCAYHFPFCANDVLSYDQVCFSVCKAMNDTCGITLDKFAHVGMRCNFKKIDPNNIGQVTRGNQRCTAGGSRPGLSFPLLILPLLVVLYVEELRLRPRQVFNAG